ncbi:hypothetical protein [Thalassospira xiamenensis]|jgi:hypothetical protein|uniref:Uncharacterized protein n=1 Tax=Thalassospira xiamenensis TaxID=220697 RepID=A0A367WVJ9_9PROT|nr:hypothetical protein [Thalassospira xiamenensis]KZB54238.1 hypothetical protein AUP41_19975 [Thalassospira xiamenensis]RCK44531.1 hypothetical protein TH44_22420 [Thalassospira xiamenensis]HBN49474.1 hypothetical protein [Thalassospira sp.]|tara:strand:- start:715 stop:987 length:273 start_codon:yes stop_codon:yes gene_type:complete
MKMIMLTLVFLTIAFPASSGSIRDQVEALTPIIKQMQDQTPAQDGNLDFQQPEASTSPDKSNQEFRPGSETRRQTINNAIKVLEAESGER